MLSSQPWSRGSRSGGRSVLPVFVTKETSRKRDSLDSFTSSSFKDSSFKDTSFAASFGALSIQSVDYKQSLPSPSSDADSIEPPSYPPTTHEVDDDDIEISSIRRLSTASAFVVDVPAPPAPVLNLASVPRHTVDAPTPIPVRRDSAEVV